MSEKKDLLFIHALTGLHPGSGTALGVVDLPIQRERHTQWPVIPGSSLKGVLRDLCREKIRKNGSSRKDADKDPELVSVFGPPSGDADLHAGAMSFTDARILAYPVRSLKGVFAWATCPGVLERLGRDVKLAEKDGIAEWPRPQENHASFGGQLEVEKRLVLEEFDFQPMDQEPKRVKLAEWIAARATSDKMTQERIKSHLVVLHDNDFTHFVRHATEVVARVGLNYDTKTVRKGALFYQEFLPPETIFYSVAIATESRKSDHKMDAGAVLGFVGMKLAEKDGQLAVIQIGGDETIGKGLCAVRFMNGKES